MIQSVFEHINTLINTSNNMSNNDKTGNNQFLLNESINTIMNRLDTAILNAVQLENWISLKTTLTEIKQNGVTETSKDFVWKNYDALIKAGVKREELTCVASNFEHACNHQQVVNKLTETIMDWVWVYHHACGQCH